MSCIGHSVCELQEHSHVFWSFKFCLINEVVFKNLLLTVNWHINYWSFIRNIKFHSRKHACSIVIHMASKLGYTDLYMCLYLTLILLTWRIGWAPNNSSKWQMGFNSAFKRLMGSFIRNNVINLLCSLKNKINLL